MTGHGSAAVAIVGMACRFAGGIDSPASYWSALSEGRHFSGELPGDRDWNLGQFDRPLRGAFLDDVAGFDAAFFGIGPKEAVAMDPQQRLLLECGWHAVEDARIDPWSLRGSRTGVYVGIGDSWYQRTDGTADISGVEAYLGTGLGLSVAAGRISYVLGLHGPALAVDTACSSSLVATHLAVRALRGGECEMALAAGVCVLAGPDTLIHMSRNNALAEDGVSRAFAADARGFGAAEGVGAMLLMPLDRAVAQRRRVLAVIRGTAVNEDGASETLTVPNGAAQRAVMAAALADAGLGAGEIDLIEAHGTGTTVGDPIEAASLNATYAAQHSTASPVWVGSAKSCIGHCQAAAGMAGLIKVVLALRHEQMPATLHAEQPLRSADWSGSMRLLQQPRPWPAGDVPRRAGALSYGIAGTNAHVVVEEAPPAPVATSECRRSGYLWPVYAASGAALRDQAAALAAQVRRCDVDAADVGWSLGTTRAALPVRAVVHGADHAELLAGLDSLAGSADEEPAARADDGGRVAAGPGPVFVFPGQGGQWAGMGARLLAESAEFAAALRRCARALDPWVSFDVAEVMRAGTALDRADVAQPTLFAFYVALADLWQAHGVRPAAVIGHSQGEIAAACVAGALSLEEAARIVSVRGAALRMADDGQGAMASLALPEDRVRPLLQGWPGQLEIAVLNGPAATTVSGDARAVAELIEHCERQQIWARVLPVDYAAHSRQVEQVRERLARDLGEVICRPPTVPMISTVTGKPAGDWELDADYWYRNLRQPVLFDAAIRTALRSGYRQFIELSPNPVLVSPVREILAEESSAGHADGTLRREQDGLAGFIGAVATAHTHGADVDWAALYPAAQAIDLPLYRFQHRRFWLPRATRTTDLAATGLEQAHHPWLGAALTMPSGATVLCGRLSLADQPWLADHAVHGTVLLPATGFAELLAHAARRAHDGCRLQNLMLHAPLVLGETPARIQVHCSAAAADGSRALALSSSTGQNAGDWTLHAEATSVPVTTPEPQAEQAGWPPAGSEPVAIGARYDELRARGYAYGPAFRNLTGAWRADGGICAEARLADQQADGFALHPALLDAVLHPLIGEDDGDKTLLPYAIGSFQVFRTGARTLRATITGAESGRISLRAADESGRPVATIENLRLRPVSMRQLRVQLAAADQTVFRPAWHPAPAITAEPGTATAHPDASWAAITSADDLPVQCAYTDVAALISALADSRNGQDDAVPELIVLDCRAAAQAGPAALLGRAARDRLSRLLTDVQALLAHDPLHGTRLLVLTRHAECTALIEAVDPPSAACAGLARCAASEYPGRIQVVDVDDLPITSQSLADVLASGRPRTALREGKQLVPSLAPAHDNEALQLPADGSPWRLAASPRCIVDEVRPAAAPDLALPVPAGYVRVRVAATGVNFRDAAVATGLVETAALGYDVAGTVMSVAGDVTGWHPGDRVMAGLPAGRCQGGYAPFADVPHEQLVWVPDSALLARAAGIPAVFATAYYALVKHAAVQPGEKVLIHSAAGGVGRAAIGLARRLGAEVYGTASPAKHRLLRDAGIPADHVANSRNLGFETRLRYASKGLDVIVGSLSGELVDASLRLLRPGGRYVELGVTDVRDPGDVAASYPGVTYSSLDLRTVRTDPGAVPYHDAWHTPLPTQAWNVRYARQVLRLIGQGRTTGKIVLTQPAGLDPGRTVLITGGTGTLGALLARHLVSTHRARHLLLISRQGPDADGAAELGRELRSAGASVTIAACDAADRLAVGRLLAGIDPGHRLGTVIHAAGTLDDALLTDLDQRKLDGVLHAKVDAAVNLHDVTANIDLENFIMYSSLAAELGNPGQGNYAAANAFLDAFAVYRRQHGMPAISISWGLWKEASGLTATMTAATRGRLARNGLAPLTTGQALAAFDAALDLDRPHLAVTALSDQEHAMFSRPAGGVVAGGVTVAGGDAAALSRLREQPAGERLTALTTMVRRHAAAILGHASFEDIDPHGTLRAAGFDSLATLELRTRLGEATGVGLAATVVLDHPTPAALAQHINTQLDAGSSSDSVIDTVAGQLLAGNRATAQKMAEDAARQRRHTGDPALLDAEWMPLSDGPDTVTVLCLPALPSSPEPGCPQTSAYYLLAQRLNDTARLWTASLPGYRSDPLPADLPAALQALVAALPAGSPGRRYVVLGHCTGGRLAAAFAQALAEHHHPVHGLIMINAPREADDVPEELAAAFSQRIATVSKPETIEHLTAVASYMRLVYDLPAAEPDVATLFLHPDPSVLRDSWPASYAFRALPGDHDSILDSHAGHTADAITQWLHGASLVWCPPRRLAGAVQAPAAYSRFTVRYRYRDVRPRQFTQ